MIVKILACAYCGKTFSRKDYPSRFKVYSKSYCSKQCAMLGAKQSYKPTQITTIKNGVFWVRIPNHPNANKNQQVPLAHLIIEASIGRYLKPNEVVHHKDCNPQNNDIKNLKLMSISDHVKLHNKLKKRGENGRFLPKSS